MAVALLATAITACSMQPGPISVPAAAPSAAAVIVQGASAEAARAAVEAAGGTVTHELGIIRAVGATLTAAQRSALEGDGQLRLYDDRRVEVQATAETVRDSFSSLVGGGQAPVLQSFDISGFLSATTLAAYPGLSPDDVKCRLIASARPAVDANGELANAVFQQGADLIDALAAAKRGDRGCANAVLDVAMDLAGVEHYGGPASQDADGRYYVMNPDCPQGCPRSLQSNGYIWSNAELLSAAYIWSSSYADLAAYIWSTGFVEPAAVNVWVEQE